MHVDRKTEILGVAKTEHDSARRRVIHADDIDFRPVERNVAVATRKCELQGTASTVRKAPTDIRAVVAVLRIFD